MLPSFFNVKKLAEVVLAAGIGQVERRLGNTGVSEHIPSLVQAGLGHFKVPESIEVPMTLEVIGKLAFAGWQRQQQIEESHRRAMQDANEA